MYGAYQEPRRLQTYVTAGDRRRVVFVSTGDASRAAMAAAWLAQLGGDAFEVRAAGTEVTSAIDTDVRHVMREVGIELADDPPPRANALQRADYDLMIVLRPREAGEVPALPPVPEVLYWSFSPIEESDQLSTEDRLTAVRRMRDELRTRVGFLVTAK
jgi:protein-tyrosine-phosphatase